MLLTDHHLEFLSLEGGCTGSSESTLVKLSHCWKSHVTAHLISSGTKYTQQTISCSGNWSIYKGIMRFVLFEFMRYVPFNNYLLMIMSGCLMLNQ